MRLCTRLGCAPSRGGTSVSRLPIRVVKVGGSLLQLPDLAGRLRKWLSEQSLAHHVLVVGGGQLADEVRSWHQQSPLREEAAHWMCVDVLTVTAHLLHDRLPEIPLVEDGHWLLQRVGDQACTIFGPATWMRVEEPRLPGTSLPASWDVTSDSIAARLAIGLVASELVLMKAKPAPCDDLSRLSEQGYVDAFIPRLKDELPAVRFVGLGGSEGG